MSQTQKKIINFRTEKSSQDIIDDAIRKRYSKKPLTIERVASIISGITMAHEKPNYDEFHVKFFWGERVHDEEIEITMHAKAEESIGGKRIPIEVFREAISYFAYQRKRDRLKEYLLKCKEKWEKDRINRLEHFFADVFGVPRDKYSMTVAKNFFLSAVARALNPGCFQKYVLVIQGPQNWSKSRVIATLGGEFYRELNVSVTTEKDFYMAIQGVWIIEIPENDAFRKAHNSRTKAVISSTTDRFRPPYSRVVRDFPRRCIFVISTNEETVYEDPSGGSRFWPVKICHPGNVEYVQNTRDLLWGEATYRYLQGESYWEMPEQVEKEQERVRRHDEWESIISDYIALNNIHEITITKIAKLALGIEAKDLHRHQQDRISNCLSVLGFEKRVVWRDNKTKKIWIKKS